MKKEKDCPGGDLSTLSVMRLKKLKKSIERGNSYGIKRQISPHTFLTGEIDGTTIFPGQSSTNLLVSNTTS